jgi:hypothetical protein
MEYWTARETGLLKGLVTEYVTTSVPPECACLGAVTVSTGAEAKLDRAKPSTIATMDVTFADVFIQNPP